MGSLLLISGTAIDHLHSTEMDESDLCGALTQYSLSINALTVDGAIYAECFFSLPYIRYLFIQETLQAIEVCSHSALNLLLIRH